MTLCPRLKNQVGFTLIEMAVVIVIVGIIISIAAGVLPSLIASSKIKQTQALLEKADYAIQGYSIANHRLPFADSGTDGIEDVDVHVGNLPYRTLGLSSGHDVWGESIAYAVYGVAGGANNLTQAFADANAFCQALNNATTASFDIAIGHTTTASPCGAADATSASNQAFIVASGGLNDLDGANGRFDDCNGIAGTGFNVPGKIQDTTYDDLLRAFSINELNQKNCSGGGGGGGGGGGVEICNNGIDDDGDSQADCLDADCAADPACAAATPVDITTVTIPSGIINQSYSTSFAATGGLMPYIWSLTNNGGFSDFAINAGTGMLTGTLDQCPGNYTVSVEVDDSTLPADGGPLSDTDSFTLQVTSNLMVSRTSGAGVDITWTSPTQVETFQATGGYLGTINWTLNTGGATGFIVTSTGSDTCSIRKIGTTTPGLYGFTLTATDSSCVGNSDALILNVTVTAAGGAAPGGIAGVVDNEEFSSNQTYNPDIIHISGDIYAVAHRGQSSDGFIRTVQITSDGQISTGVIDTFEFDNQGADNPSISHVSGDIFAVAYTDNNGDGRVATMTIASDGRIGNSTVDIFEFDGFNCYEPDMIQVSSDIFAIAYGGPFWEGGRLVTLQIDGTGNITNSVVDSLTFDGSWWYGGQQVIVNVSGDVYTIAYRDSDGSGHLITLTIDGNGLMGTTTIDQMEFYAGNIADPDMVQVSGAYYAIAHEGDNGDGFVTTVEIASDGQITNTVIDTLEFAPVDGHEPVILSAGGDIFGLAYRGPGEDGDFCTVQIDSNGRIANSVLDSYQFDTRTGYEPSMVTTGAGVFAIAYRGQGNDGDITTIALE